jgi:hypothetical protein
MSLRGEEHFGEFSPLSGLVGAKCSAVLRAFVFNRASKFGRVY